MKADRIKSGLVAIICLCICCQWGQAASEYQLKAACIYNFIQFVEWPSESLAKSNSPIVIGILGEDPFGEEIDKIFRDQHLNQHPFVVQRFDNVDQVGSCHVLFVSRSEIGNIPHILEWIGDRSIFSISDISEFANRGGILEFLSENDKLRFKINAAAARRCRIQVSSKLLRLAKTVFRKGT